MVDLNGKRKKSMSGTDNCTRISNVFHSKQKLYFNNCSISKTTVYEKNGAT